jgi:polyhydroxyalkanoate synthesis regulator protein
MNTITIKRYVNRKLYNVDTARYINLNDIAEYILQGQNFKVLDNLTKKDITELTKLKTLVYLEECRKPGTIEITKTEAFNNQLKKYLQ